MRHTVRLPVLLAVLVGSVYAEDWSQFSGPSRDGTSQEKGLLQKWPEGGPQLLWRSDKIGHGWSSVAIIKGTVYISGVIDPDLAVTSLDADGKVLWQRLLGPARKKGGIGSRSTPTIDGDRLYILSDTGTVYCMTIADGRKVWSVNLVERYGARQPTWSISESVLVDGDKVICAPGGRVSTVALDKKTGHQLWTSPPVDGITGYAAAVVPFTETIDEVDDLLTLKGLRLIHERNR